MNTRTRPDLSNKYILLTLAAALMCMVTIFLIPSIITPGSNIGQTAAFIGAFFLLAPFIFSLMKRSGLSKSPPFWFVIHVLFAFIGSVLIAVHVSNGHWLSPPGFILFCLFFLIIQGSLLRVFLSKKLSLLFARSSDLKGFIYPRSLNKGALNIIIKQKIRLLKSIDSDQNEALFSPALKHWFWHPIKSIQYQLLADKEAKLVGARESAGWLMNWSRRIHIFMAVLFLGGLIAHIVIILFFAGYAANGGDINWWYITAWGR